MLSNLSVPTIDFLPEIPLCVEFVVVENTVDNESITFLDKPHFSCDYVTAYTLLSSISTLTDQSSTKPVIDNPFFSKNRFGSVWISSDEFTTPIYDGVNKNTLLGAAASYNFYSYSERDKGNWSEFIEEASTIH